MIIIINFSPFWVLLLIFFITTDSFEKYIFAFVIALLHEAGHLLVAKFLGYKIEGLKVEPFGVCLKIRDTKITNIHELMICVAGPAINVLLIVLGTGLVKFGYNIPSVFFLSNFYMLFVNLLPVIPLDGGRILKAVLLSEFSNENSKKIIKSISVVCTFIIFVCGIVFFCRSRQNISLFIVSLFLLDNVRFSESKAGTIASMYFSDVGKDLSKVYYVGENILVKDALKFLPYNNINIVFIVNNDGRVVGTVTNKYILKLVSDGYGTEKLSNVVKSY